MFNSHKTKYNEYIKIKDVDIYIDIVNMKIDIINIYQE